MVNPSKNRGTAFETLIKRYLIDQGFEADRQVLSGAKDLGDLKVWGVDAVFECKACKKMDLSGWLRETEVERVNAGKSFGFTIAKRRGTNNPAEQFALMPVETLVELLKIAYPTAIPPA